MGSQLYRRLPQAFVVEMLEAFNEHRMTEVQACALLGIQRARLYGLRREWLRQRATWVLAAPRRVPHGWGAEVKAWLHQECRVLRDEVAHGRGAFNCAVLAERAHQALGVELSRSGVRRWAIRQGYYSQPPSAVRKVYVRWESVGPGALWHHDTSHHCWLPRLGGYQDLILTQDDYSRRIVGWRLEVQETLWAHLCLVQETIAQWGRPLAYYVDEHGFFRYVAHGSYWRRYRPKTDEGQVQFRRALGALEVGVVYAQSAQAKGKIEKRFDYFQRRLPQQCARYRVTSLAQARPILEELVGYYNERRRHQGTGETPAERWARGVRARPNTACPGGRGLERGLRPATRTVGALGREGPLPRPALARECTARKPGNRLLAA